MKRVLFAASVLLALAACASGKKVPADYVALPEGVSVETYTYAVKGTDTLQLDFYRNTALEGPQPTFVYVHGGSWADGTRKDAKWIGRVAKHGLNAVSITYRLANKGKEIGDSTVSGPSSAMPLPSPWKICTMPPAICWTTVKNWAWTQPK